MPCRCAIVVSVKSTMVRAEMPCWGSTVADLNQFRSGATRWVIPMESVFACIMCHIVSGAMDGETISVCTR